MELVYAAEVQGGAHVVGSTRANVNAPFGAAVDVNASGQADLSRDRLSLYSADYVNPIVVQHRAALGDPFGPKIALGGEVNPNPSIEPSGAPTISADELELYFRSDRDGASAPYVARRDSPTSDVWTVARMDIAMWAGDPEISADGHFLYFTGSDSRIWVISRCE